jgi:hypothetical protein
MKFGLPKNRIGGQRWGFICIFQQKVVIPAKAGIQLKLRPRRYEFFPRCRA